MTSLRHNSESIGSAAPSDVDAYLDAARACILDVGWRRTTLTEVARRSGVSRMTIYRRWSDMPTLLADLMTREWGGVAATHQAEEDLVEAMVATVQTLRDNELFVRIVELDPELLLPYVLNRRGRSQQAILDILEVRITSAQQAGTVRPGSAAAIARALLLACHGFVLSAHTMVDDAVDEAALDDELRRLLAGVLAP